MIRLLSTLALGLGLSSTALADDYKVDDGHSTVLFSIQHFNAAWVYGRFNDVSGTFTWDSDPGKFAIDVTVKADSVDTDHAKRDEHLRNADFFNTAEFPDVSFKSTKVSKKDDKTYEVTGDMTLHGVTKSVTIPLTHTGEGPDPWGGYRLGLHGEITIKRSDFGMTHMAEGLSDDVKLIVSFEGTKQ